LAKKATRPGARKNVFKATLTRFANKHASHGRARFGGWRKILMHRFAPGPEIPDPVSLAVFAIDRVGPAAVCACASGVEVRVAAPDEARVGVPDSDGTIDHGDDDLRTSGRCLHQCWKTHLASQSGTLRPAIPVDWSCVHLCTPPGNKMLCCDCMGGVWVHGRCIME